MRDFMHQLTLFATAVETDTHEIKAAMALPAKTSSVSTTNALMLEDMKEESERIRDSTTHLLHSLTSPTLEELCELCAGLYDANAALADALEDHLVEHTGGKYERHQTQADLHDVSMQNASRLSGSGLNSFGAGEEGSSVLDSSKRASNLGSGGTGYQSPAPLPAHLQVEPKTPDLEDFEISSFSLGILQSAQPATQSQPSPPSLLNLSPPSPPRPAPSAAPEPPAEGGGELDMVSSRRRGGDAVPAMEAVSETLFPLMLEVTEEELRAVPDYLRSQISCSELNGAIKKMNLLVTDKRFAREGPESGDTLAMDEIQTKLKLGLKAKAFVLLLTTLQRLKTVKRKGAIVYAIVS